ncbi:MAG TPA: outer membrane beta-barrel protein [Kofleriaceae bacterium]|jgi:hypothetical protein
MRFSEQAFHAQHPVGRVGVLDSVRARCRACARRPAQRAKEYADFALGTGAAALQLVMMKLSLVAATLFAVSTASADSTLITTPQHRDGMVLGATIDGGHIGCETDKSNDCGSGVRPAGGFSIMAGGMITPMLALTGELWGMGHTEDSITASQLLATVNLRAWIVPRLWVQGGLGAARSKLTWDDGNFVMAMSTSDVVPAFTAAVGVELVHSPTFALDLQLRGGSGFYRGDARVWNTALGLGATWY